MQFTGQDSDLTFLDVTDQKQVVTQRYRILKEHCLARPEELRLLPAERNILIRKVLLPPASRGAELGASAGTNKQMVYNALPTGQKEPSPVSEATDKKNRPRCPAKAVLSTCSRSSSTNAADLQHPLVPGGTGENQFYLVLPRH